MPHTTALLSRLLNHSLVLLLLLRWILLILALVFTFRLAVFVNDGVFIGKDGGASDFLHSLVLAVYSAPAASLLHHVKRVDVVETGLAHLYIIDSVHHAFILFPDCFSLPYNSTHYCELTDYAHLKCRQWPLMEFHCRTTKQSAGSG